MGFEMTFEKQSEEQEEYLKRQRGRRDPRGWKKLHSLPISEADRAKREHEAAEHQRFEDVYGDLKITRDSDNYVVKTEKLAEDIVVERTYSRDENHYVVGVAVRIRKKKRLV